MRRWLSFAALLCVPWSAAAERHYVYADVVDVRPLTHCEPTPRRGVVVPIVGAVLGGLLGNQFGGGSGRAALTVAGAALGAGVANRVGGRPAGCQSSAYQVRYRYQGHEFVRRMASYPDEQILVAVDVEPLGFTNDSGMGR